MPPKKYNTEAERKAANARQKLESQKRNGHKNQMAYDKATGWSNKKAQRARAKLAKALAKAQREAQIKLRRERQLINAQLGLATSPPVAPRRTQPQVLPIVLNPAAASVAIPAIE